MSTVQVLLGDRSYAIRIVPGGLAELPVALGKEFESERAVVLTTSRVAREHQQTLLPALAASDCEGHVIEVPDGDGAKSLLTVGRVYDQLAALEIRRGTPLLALGGGALCDVAGFVAGTYLRGLPLVLVPTSLRAQVDSSVGGKNALHHRGIPNLIGTFHQPSLVWVDPHLVRTLPAREVRAGMAELVKLGAIWKLDLFDWLEDKIAGLLAQQPDALCEAVIRAIQSRAEIVGLDERNGGLRSLLLFGERLAELVRRRETQVEPGMASAVGMRFAAELSAQRGWIDPEDAGRLDRLLEKVGFPRELPGWEEKKGAYLRALADDKTAGEALPEWILLRELGRGERTEVSTQELLSESS